MISVLSVGIQNYRDIKMQNIDCALLDSKRVYNAFRDILGEDFSEHYSICLSNIFADVFKSALSCYRFLFSEEQNSDVLIIYFSGHAKTINGNYVLCFSDFDENYSGYVSLDEFAQLLNNISSDKIVILDCCFSGNGLELANVQLNHRVSILTSNNHNGCAEFSSEGSQFTMSLCESIYEIKSENIDFTLNELQNRVNSKHSSSCFNMGAGQTGSITLKTPTNMETVYFDFDKRFYNRISRSDRFFREAFWYSLSGLPFAITQKVYNDIFRCFNPFSSYPLEASWLVRRAIGSSISCIENDHNRLYIAKNLIMSSFWQEQCIGIIGARYDFEKDEELCELVKTRITNNSIRKIDAVWLANLYLAENENYDYHIFLNSSLASNSWGIQEIYCSATRHCTDFDSFLKSLESIIDKKGFCSKAVVDEWQDSYINSPKSKSSLYNTIDTRESRGRLPKNSKAKFILSSLYGNWRGNKTLNLRNYFESQKSEIIKHELNEAARFARIEFRMAIFDYLTGHPDLINQYKEYIIWGLSDAHPWVRRSAIQAFKSADFGADIINNSIIEYFKCTDIEHIGEFDLILEYIEKDTPANSRILTFIKVNSNRFSESDYTSIFFSIYNYF